MLFAEYLLRKSLIPVLIFMLPSLMLPSLMVAQVQDNFSDGDFTQNPTWLGDASLFQVNAAFELQSKGLLQNDTLTLSTPFSHSGQTEWRFTVRYGFAPSTTNLVRVYLLSDQPSISGATNGYYIEAGEIGSLDSYDLYRQDGTSRVRLIDGMDGLAGTTIDADLRITRDATGKWELLVDQGGQGNFQHQGSAIDLTYPLSGYIGLYVKHTSTRSDAFFFDNVYAGGTVTDTLPPQVLSVNVLANDRLEVTFSEPTDSLSAITSDNYQVFKGTVLQPLAAVNWLSDTRVQLLLTNTLVAGNYTLEVAGVADTASNAMNLQAINFSISPSGQVSYRGVRISEIMADPTPVVGLPDAEYLELQNFSGLPVNLANWTLNNGTTLAALPAFVLDSGAQVIVCRLADTALLSPYGNVIGLSTWPALVNGGDDLGLRANGLMIDTVSYKLSWYGDAAKSNGGYSLELLNTLYAGCPEPANWLASTDPSGGTPGKVNSLASLPLDLLPPNLVSVSVNSPSSISVCFNESMDPTSMGLISNYRIDLQSVAVLSVLVDADNQCVTLTLDQPLPLGVITSLIIQPIADCKGNLPTAPWSRPLVRARKALPFEIVISEIFPDPTPSVQLPESEFVEITNRSQEALTLDGLSITDGVSQATLPALVLLPGEYALLIPRADTADWSVYGTLAPLSALPSLNNDRDSLILFNETGNLVDAVYYQSSWLGDKISGGYSLEKIDLDLIDCNQPGNWKPSSDPRGGTPASVNSITGSYSDSEAPAITTFAWASLSSILISFSEPLDPVLAENNLVYSLNPSLGVPAFAWVNNTARTEVVLTWAAEVDTNTVYTLEINGLADCLGNTLVDSIRLAWPGNPSPGDILLNEILFNPLTGGADFVEILNFGLRAVDLSALKIGEGFPGSDSVFNSYVIASRSILLMPGELVCLTREVDLQKSTYLPPANARFYEMSGFPSYDDREGAAVVTTKNGLVLDRFDYLDDYQYPTLDKQDGVSLERISPFLPTQQPSNWHSAASTVNFATPGYENSQSEAIDTTEQDVVLSPQVFSPDGDGQSDVLGITCKFPFQGGNLRIMVMDTQGRLVKNLQNNVLMGTESVTYFWDGTDRLNRRAPVGMYVVLVEVVRTDTGKKLAYRRVGVLAEKM